MCACAYLLSVRVKHLKTFIFRPAIMLHFLHNSRCQRRQSSPYSFLCSALYHLLLSLSLFLSLHSLFSAISILRLFFVPSAVWFLLLVNGSSSCWVCLDWVGTNKGRESGALDLSTDSDKNAQRAASQTVKHP